MKKLYLSLFVLLSISIFSCREDTIIEHEETEPEIEVPNFYALEVLGRVVDYAGIGISGAEVMILDDQIFTDEFGFFEKDDILAPETGLYINVTKDGYFVGGTQVNPVREDVITLGEPVIRLKSKANPFFFNSTEDIQLTTTENASVFIPANSLSINGQNYIGDIEINTLWLDVTEESMLELMPGALLGMNMDNDIQVLKSFGMMAVDITTNNGEELQITEGAKATISMPVPSELLSSAPSSIPLWHFDETIGIWEEEGSADLIGNDYVGEVSHFSWWNCDVPFDLAFLCITFEDSNGNPITDQKYTLESETFGRICANLASSNVACDFVLENEQIEVSLVDNCGLVTESTTIGPFTGEENNEIVVFENAAPENSYVVQGTILDCDGNPVDNGFVELSTGSNTFNDYTLENGSYRIEFTFCAGDDQNISIRGVDLQNFVQDETNQSLGGPDTYIIDVPACNEQVASFFSIQQGDAEPFIVGNCLARKTVDETTITAGNLILLGVDGFDVGDFQGNLITIGQAPQVAEGTFPFEFNETSISISEYGEVGGRIIGTFVIDDFSGQFIADRVQ